MAICGAASAPIHHRAAITLVIPPEQPVLVVLLPVWIVQIPSSPGINQITAARQACRYSVARLPFGGFANMERPKLNLRPGPDAALIFMKGIGILPRTKKNRVEKWEWQITVCTPSVTMGISSTPERSPAITIPIEWAKQLVDGHDIELRSGARLVIRLERKPK
jgi:hypothetical protein